MDYKDLEGLFKEEDDLEMFENPHIERDMELEKRRNEREKKFYSKLISLLSVVLCFGFLAFLLFLSA
ncbi:MAG: hypothetical protein IJS17_06730, partial [Clostridia bacterium]|nr:hypothetical protein [Clostridia bacterium]